MAVYYAKFRDKTIEPMILLCLNERQNYLWELSLKKDLF
jgi:hypothetical protein